MGKLNISIHSTKHCKDCIWLQSLPHFSRDYDVELISWNSACAIVAIDEQGHPAGLWKFTMRGSRLRSSGTWVRKDLRKHGIAKKLWEFGISHFKPTHIKVLIASMGGYYLISSIQSKFPEIKWTVEDDDYFRKRGR